MKSDQNYYNKGSRINWRGCWIQEKQMDVM